MWTTLAVITTVATFDAGIPGGINNAIITEIAVVIAIHRSTRNRKRPLVQNNLPCFSLLPEMRWSSLMVSWLLLTSLIVHSHRD
jgi:hypothetical protein